MEYSKLGSVNQRRLTVVVPVLALLMSAVVQDAVSAQGRKGTKGRNALDQSLRAMLHDQGVYVPDSGIPDNPDANLIAVPKPAAEAAMEAGERNHTDMRFTPGGLVVESHMTFKK